MKVRGRFASFLQPDEDVDTAKCDFPLSFR